MKSIHLLVASALTLTGCMNPRSTVSIPTDGPRMLLLNAPAGAMLSLDGKPLGEARRYNGKPEVLQVEVGTHLVEVHQGDKLLWSQKIYFGSNELRSIQL